MEQYRRQSTICNMFNNTIPYKNITDWTKAWKTINHFLQNPKDITDNELAELFRIGIDMYKPNSENSKDVNFEESDVKHRLHLFEQYYLPIAKEIFIVAEANFDTPFAHTEIIAKNT